MNRTKIPTIKNPDGTPGYTWNPFHGCLYHVDGICNGGGFPCYAYGLAHGRLKKRYLANDFIAPIIGALPGVALPVGTKAAYNNPFYPRFNGDSLCAGDAFLRGHKKPVGVFPCSMSDWCGIGIPESWSNWIIEEARRYPRHRFYLLTKQPQNLLKFSPFPDNCWVGVTATDHEMYKKALVGLGDIEAKVKYISLEPLLHRIGVKWYEPQDWGVDWLIIGAQTKPTVMPKIEWVKEIVEAADEAGVKVFLKDSLKPIIEPLGLVDGEWAAKEWVMCKYPVLRQEVPS